jgi:hypothetical protein
MPYTGTRFCVVAYRSQAMLDAANADALDRLEAGGVALDFAALRAKQGPAAEPDEDDLPVLELLRRLRQEAE